jgi:hypothetical protein
LMHAGIMGLNKLSSSNDHRVGQYPTIFMVMYTGIIYGPPTDSPERCHVEDVHWGKVGRG